MKSKLALGAVVAAIAVFSQTAFAQAAASAPVTREQRKADTAAANKAGQLAPAGEGKAGADQRQPGQSRSPPRGARCRFRPCTRSDASRSGRRTNQEAVS